MELCQVQGTGSASLSLDTTANIFLSRVLVIKLFLTFHWVFLKYFFSPPVNLDFQEYPSVVLPQARPATNVTWAVPEGHQALKTAGIWNSRSEKQQKWGIPTLKSSRVRSYHSEQKQEWGVTPTIMSMSSC